ncbi:fasciclin domain-containing protein [Kitasatospora sp. NPDC092948]|uniref:fasciclin domain-containing protein n=1 Tax=Kitasatospora sp. NPDC092948 TaxID=3364088 RepID=UPI0038201012
MAQGPVATAASNDSLLSTPVAAVKEAGSVGTLDFARNIMVFAPAGDAFAGIPKAGPDALLAGRAGLAMAVTCHVTPERLVPDSLTGAHETLGGASLAVAGSEPVFGVNGNSEVLCGGVRTADAAVRIGGTVLVPAS